MLRSLIRFPMLVLAAGTLALVASPASTSAIQDGAATAVTVRHDGVVLYAVSATGSGPSGTLVQMRIDGHGRLVSVRPVLPRPVGRVLVAGAGRVVVAGAAGHNQRLYTTAGRLVGALPRSCALFKTKTESWPVACFPVRHRPVVLRLLPDGAGTVQALNVRTGKVTVVATVGAARGLSVNTALLGPVERHLYASYLTRHGVQVRRVNLRTGVTRVLARTKKPDQGVLPVCLTQTGQVLVARGRIIPTEILVIHPNQLLRVDLSPGTRTTTSAAHSAQADGVG